ncbi:hypothetical protein FACS1894205_2990 [Alphaproteobacteria bacterium]|nr:hypothetical protein FACS1894205_2990 [Alphaproteobacteria bacterium]
MTKPEFSRPLDVASLGAGVKKYKIEANEQERKALAERFRILSVDRFCAEIELFSKKALVCLKGTLDADVTQSCVVTLAPVRDHIEERFSLVYSSQATEDACEVDVFFDGEDPPEAILNGVIDIAEVASEHLALALDPFPRIEGAHFEGIIEKDDVPNGAFGALAVFMDEINRKK